MSGYRLPWPPTVNHYYHHTPRGTFVTKAGKAYRRDVCKLRRPQQPFTGKIGVLVECHPPDHGRHDLDNLGKCLLDALQAAGYYHDDAQIDDLRFVRRPVAEFARGMKGLVVVSLWTLDTEAAT